MKIGDRAIASGHEPYVIAEIGVNHDGSPQRALELTRAAASAGASAVKLQLFQADLLMSRAATLAVYQAKAGESDPLAMLRRLELPIGSMGAVVDRAHALGIDAIVTVFSPDLVDAAESLDWDAHKTASPDLVNRPLLDALLRTNRPLIVSTGAATMDEVLRTAEWIEEAGAHGRTALLQCVSAYPADDDGAAIGGVDALARATGLPIGYSDHTVSLDTGALAVAAGACVLEKHLTYSRVASGPDHGASLEPAQFAEYVRLANRAARMVGQRMKALGEAERDVRRVSRQSIVCRRPISKGETIEREHLTVKRPGTGIEPWRIDEIVGRAASRDIPADMPLQPADIEQAVPARRGHG